MTWQDLVNGGFEMLGAPFILISIYSLQRTKTVSGVSYVHTGLFWMWGFWNLYYYPHLDQWASFYGGLAIVLTNGIWMTQQVYYTRNPGGITASVFAMALATLR